jgi:capsular polysaccharide biosynthesis protein
MGSYILTSIQPAPGMPGRNRTMHQTHNTNRGHLRIQLVPKMLRLHHHRIYQTPALHFPRHQDPRLREVHILHIRLILIRQANPPPSNQALIRFPITLRAWSINSLDYFNLRLLKIIYNLEYNTTKPIGLTKLLYISRRVQRKREGVE